jgi:hypothetical protein
MYEDINYLSLRSMVLLQKLIFAQLLKKFPSFMELVDSLPCLKGSVTRSCSDVQKDFFTMRAKSQRSRYITIIYKM